MKSFLQPIASTSRVPSHTSRRASRWRKRLGPASVATALGLVTACALEATPAESGGAAAKAGDGGRGGSAGSSSAGRGGSGTGGSTAGKTGSGGRSGATGEGGEAGESSMGASGGRSGTGSGGTSGDAGAGGNDGTGAAGTGAAGTGAAGKGAAGGPACSPGTDEDRDQDGFSIADGDCDDCNALVNPGAFDVPDNDLDDDCDDDVDQRPVCDASLASNSSSALDFARTLDLCATVTEASMRPGVLDAKLTLADGTGVPYANGHAIRAQFGTGLEATLGSAFAVLSTGVAAGVGDTDPAPASGPDTDQGKESGLPGDYLLANGNQLPTPPGCPPITASVANDPVMLTLTIRTPTNAKSFSLRANHFSYEFPEWVCSSYNDFFVVLLDSGWDGTPKNPDDKNLAVSVDDGIPVGANLALGSPGLFRQCVNGGMGCVPGGTMGTIASCEGTNELVGTRFDTPSPGDCDAGSLAGGATGWLKIAGNVVGGEIITVRIAIWDSGDSAADSTVVLDAFEWSTDVVEPGATAD